MKTLNDIIADLEAYEDGDTTPSGVTFLVEIGPNIRPALVIQQIARVDQLAKQYNCLSSDLWDGEVSPDDGKSVLVTISGTPADLIAFTREYQKLRGDRS